MALELSVASTKPRAALGRCPGWQPARGRGWLVAQRDSGREAAWHCWERHLCGNGLGLFGLGVGLGFRSGVLFGLGTRPVLAASLGDGLVDRADHVEGLLGEVVVLAVEDLGEAGDRLLERHELARLARERLGDEHRLREEALDLPRALDD